MNGKGDKKRPMFISMKQLKENWNLIFPPKKCVCKNCNCNKKKEKVNK